MTGERSAEPPPQPPDAPPTVPPDSTRTDALPPDPAAYDSERNALARARGLAAPYIAGGRDPDPENGRREERYYGRLLLLMVGAIVLGGFVLGIIANVLGVFGG